MSSSTSTSPSTMAFNTKFTPFAQNAWSRFPSASRRLTGRDLQEAIENWSRQESRTFFHIAVRQYPFVRIYSALARFANVQIGLAEQRQTTKEAPAAPIRVQKSPAVYQAKLEKFAPVAWTRYDPSQTDIANWARAEARTFYYLSDGHYPFVTAWKFLTTYGEDREDDEDERRQEQRVEAAQQATRDFEDAALVNNFSAFAVDGEQTDAERRGARAELNRILFREHSRWWDAFEAEAADDMDADAPDAAERFSWHCAKIISRRTGLREDVIVPVVGAWLLEKFEA